MSVVRSLCLVWVCIHHATCSQVNVALNKKTSTTSGIYYTGGPSAWYPSGAVDGDHDTLDSWTSCFHSRRAPADWTVDLRQEYQLYNITVYIRRNFLFRTANSTIYVDNDPSRVCYTFQSTISNNPTHLMCNETARYVTIRNPGTAPEWHSLNICEVEIYACTGGYCGVDCDVDCHCDECDRWTGICNSPCTPGREGQRCDRVCNGTYGSSCNNSCAARQCSNSSSSCDPVNGTCDSGCLAGWTGHACVTACPNSTYGLNCSNNCTNRHCKGTYACDHVTGSCDPGCKDGWISIDCTEVCPNSTYGQNCSGNCASRNCEGNSTCDHMTGSCDLGCEVGWKSSDCTKEVPDVAATEYTTTDVRTIVLSTTFAVLVVTIAVIIAVLLIRMKLKKRSSDSRSTDVNRPTLVPALQ